MSLPLLFALLGFTTLVFLNAFSAGYVMWDDNVFILNNQILKLPFFPALTESFAHGYAGDYLPFTLLSYWMEFKIFGQNPVAQHAVNLVIHLLNVGLLFVLLKKWKIARIPFFLVLAYVALHPLQVESVMWLSERKNVLSAFFVFLALFCHSSAHEKKKPFFYLILLNLFYFLSLCSKSAFILLPLLIGFLDRFHFTLPWRKTLQRQLPLCLIAIIFAVIRIQAHEVAATRLSEALWNPDRLLHLPLQALHAIAIYIRMFFYPANLSIIYPRYNPSTSALFSALAVVLIGGYACWKWRKNTPFVFFALFFGLFLLPVLQIIPLTTYVNDRYLYLPIIGLSGMVGVILQDAGSALFSRMTSKRLDFIFAIILVLSIGAGSYARTRVWVSDFALWEDTVQRIPTHPIARNNLALAYQAQGQTDLAIEEFKKAIEFGKAEGVDVYAYNNLGNIYGTDPKRRNLDLAARYYELAIQNATAPREAFESKYNLALIDVELDKKPDARRLLAELLREIAALGDPRYHQLKEMTQKAMERLSLDR